MARIRRGLGLGQGKGYKNLIKTDPVVHKLSAKGISTKKTTMNRRMTLNLPAFRFRQNHTAIKVRDAQGMNLTPDKASMVEQDFREEMNKLDIRFDSDWRNNYSTWKTSQFRHNKSVNISTYSGRRTNILNWQDWVNVNNAFNKVMNKHHVSANVSTLGGKFKVRQGTKAFDEQDWEFLSGENVGSQMRPVLREDLNPRYSAEKKAEIKREIEAQFGG